MNKRTKNNGITLISLVITIIVMLILVGVSITLAVNGGLFEYAGNAVGDTKNAINKDGELGTGSIIEKYLYNISDEVAKLPTYSEELLNETTKVLTTNAKYISNNQVAVIPKGFKIIPGLNNTTTIEDGLVIQDAEGNEFVWIPVEVVKEGENADSEKSIASFYRSNWTSSGRGTSLMDSTTWIEPYASGYLDEKGTEEKAEYYDMLKSVYTYEGFYIGRYEAGTDTDTARTNTSNKTSKMVVQRDKYPYIYVGWGESMTAYTSEITYSSKKQGLGALALSKEMYANKDVEVTSTLCYGVMWDAMLEFISTEKNVKNSTTWGNYKDNTGDSWKITRATAKWTTSPSSDKTWTTVGEEGKTKTSSESILLTTGANDNFSAKNIFDVAGNVSEWTNEANFRGYRVIRGSSNGYSGEGYPASNRAVGGPTNCYSDLGFRPALYIK